MDFDQLLSRFFGTDDLAGLPNAQLLAGVERLRAQLDTDMEDRFAIWCLLSMLGAAPDPYDVFDDADDRAAAIEFLTAMDQDEG